MGALSAVLFRGVRVITSFVFVTCETLASPSDATPKTSCALPQVHHENQLQQKPGGIKCSCVNHKPQPQQQISDWSEACSKANHDKTSLFLSTGAAFQPQLAVRNKRQRLPSWPFLFGRSGWRVARWPWLEMERCFCLPGRSTRRCCRRILTNAGRPDWTERAAESNTPLPLPWAERSPVQGQVFRFLCQDTGVMWRRGCRKLESPLNESLPKCNFPMLRCRLQS